MSVLSPKTGSNDSAPKNGKKVLTKLATQLEVLNRDTIKLEEHRPAHNGFMDYVGQPAAKQEKPDVQKDFRDLVKRAQTINLDSLRRPELQDKFRIQRAPKPPKTILPNW